MPEFDESRKIIDILKNEGPDVCPVCGHSIKEKRIFGGIKHGKDEPFDDHIYCPDCGADLTKEMERIAEEKAAKDREKIHEKNRLSI